MLFSNLAFNLSVNALLGGMTSMCLRVENPAPVSGGEGASSARGGAQAKGTGEAAGGERSRDAEEGGPCQGGAGRGQSHDGRGKGWG